MQQQNSIVIRAGIGDVFAMIAAEGNGYSPDLVHDMVARTQDLFRETLKDALELGYVKSDDEDDDEDTFPLDDDDDEEDEEVSDVGQRFWWLQ